MFSTRMNDQNAAAEKDRYVKHTEALHSTISKPLAQRKRLNTGTGRQVFTCANLTALNGDGDAVSGTALAGIDAATIRKVIPMVADPAPPGERAAQLILHRPLSLATGVERRIHVYLDDQQIADLELGNTVNVRAEEGPHLLQAHCAPLVSEDLPFVLEPEETLRVLVYVSVREKLEIEFGEDVDPERSPPLH
jgi:hypothetical protein